MPHPGVCESEGSSVIAEWFENHLNVISPLKLLFVRCACEVSEMKMVSSRRGIRMDLLGIMLGYMYVVVPRCSQHRYGTTHSVPLMITVDVSFPPYDKCCVNMSV